MDSRHATFAAALWIAATPTTMLLASCAARQPNENVPRSAIGTLLLVGQLAQADRAWTLWQTTGAGSLKVATWPGATALACDAQGRGYVLNYNLDGGEFGAWVVESGRVLRKVRGVPELNEVAIAVSPSGDYAIGTQEGDDGVTRLCSWSLLGNGGNVTDLTRGASSDPAFAADGSAFACVVVRRAHSCLRYVASDRIYETTPRQTPRELAISPDGQYVAFVVWGASRQPNELWLWAPRRGKLSRLDDGRGAWLPCFSPTGDEVMFVSEGKLSDGEGQGLYAVGLDGRRCRPASGRYQVICGVGVVRHTSEAAGRTVSLARIRSALAGAGAEDDTHQEVALHGALPEALEQLPGHQRRRQERRDIEQQPPAVRHESILQAHRSGPLRIGAAMA